LVDDPDQFGLFTVLEPDLSHAEGRGADEVGPPPVVLFILLAKILPLSQGGTSTEDYVFPDGRGEAGEGEKDRQEDQESHGPKMRQEGQGGKEGVEAVRQFPLNPPQGNGIVSKARWVNPTPGGDWEEVKRGGVRARSSIDWRASTRHGP
jgi:hypothetical protein